MHVPPLAFEGTFEAKLARLELLMVTRLLRTLETDLGVIKKIHFYLNKLHNSRTIKVNLLELDNTNLTSIGNVILNPTATRSIQASDSILKIHQSHILWVKSVVYPNKYFKVNRTWSFMLPDTSATKTKRAPSRRTMLKSGSIYVIFLGLFLFQPLNILLVGLSFTTRQI